MKLFVLPLRLSLLVLLSLSCLSGAAQVKLNYKASFKEPEKHYVEVELHCEQLETAETSFILPVWSPGYYQILNTPKNIVDFSVKNEAGQDLGWFKQSKNSWVIKNEAEKSIIISYRYFANDKSVAESMVDDTKAFVMPGNMFMHIKDQIQLPVNLSISPFKSWSSISTGLKQTDAKLHTYYAENFDVLYDSPIYIGNQKVISFQHENKSYTMGLATPEGLDEKTFVADVKTIISTTTELMGHVPYENYCFIMMEQGGGGLEHLNSQAVFTNGDFLFSSGKSYTDFMNFITHEYFHLYNVKAIRPIELGPFDYSKENYTEMLWVSEGLTVYYEYLIMLRAGLLDGVEALKYLGESMASYENYEGKNHMSLSRSSFDIWLNFFNRDENAKDVTISYYNKGPVMGLLLDLEIRQLTANKKSLDDVMRYLYNTYYLQEKRGFKKEEFWQACQEIAGQPLTELQHYVDTVAVIDYNKYLAYAGLELEIETDLEATEDSGKNSYNLVPVKGANKQQLQIRKSLFQF
ncbi:M61 family metallopeptidase [Formosa sp. S-31]|uniref:M61 family metallopeptidase n=1 Tax=Formosa sp. S-31 TaxID=2790949 RepID=UPI003EBCE451